MNDNHEHMPTEDRLKELLVGKSIVAAEIRDEAPARYESGPTGFLTLSDGVVLKVWGNDGGGVCSAGCYPLERLAACENVITNVKVEELPDCDYPDEDRAACRTCGMVSCWDDDHDNGGYYRIFVWAEDRPDDPVLLASFEGTDGNGYYGTGWWLTVEEPS